uniref:Myb/SANT-like domain-containing protein n=1 Tax=Lactuca sativa TaxID=4236 RepID=A0A9R1VVU5_LACSA|nr:hypothetical protein LSAT_V11C300111480 [Lactuca sativa]
MDNVLVEALVKEDQLGNRAHGTFTLQAYANMIAGIGKDKWYDMYRGASLSGFSWNSLTKYIEAEEEVWEQLVIVRVDLKFDLLKPLRNCIHDQKIPNYDQLVMIKTGNNKIKNSRLSKSTEIKIEKVADVDELMANNEVILDKEYKDDDEDIQIVSETDVSPDESSKAKKLKKNLQDEDEVVTESQPQPRPKTFEHTIVKTFKEIIDVMREGNKSHENTGEEIKKELELMGLDVD